MITTQEKEQLLKLARDSISSYFINENIDDPELEKKFLKKQGVFVTLTIAGKLRGCIGFVEPFFSLYDGIKQAAKGAAFEDPRFDSLTQEELKAIDIEISILSEPSDMKVKTASEYLDRIEIGKHGLVIRSLSGKSGLLLPQVPVEHKWDAKEFLEHLCEKASLPSDAWMNAANKILAFECEVFSEKEL